MAHHRVSAYPGARRPNQTEMFSVHDEMSLSIAAVSLAVGCLFHARRAAAEKALWRIRGRVRGTTRLPRDEARSVDGPGISATGIRRCPIYSVAQKRIKDQRTQQIKHQIQKNVMYLLQRSTIPHNFVRDAWTENYQKSKHFSIIAILLLEYFLKIVTIITYLF